MEHQYRGLLKRKKRNVKHNIKNDEERRKMIEMFEDKIKIWHIGDKHTKKLNYLIVEFHFLKPIDPYIFYNELVDRIGELLN